MRLEFSRLARACVSAALVALPAGAAHATCGSSYCFLDTGTRDAPLVPGTLTVDVSFQYVDQSRRREGSHATDEVLAPKIDFETGSIEPDHHREISTQNTLAHVNLAYGVTERFSVYVDLPVYNDRSHEHFDDVGTPDEAFTNRDGTTGFGDVRVGVRAGWVPAPRSLLVGDLALKLPTGRYTLLDGEGAINEPTIQPGTGSTDVAAAARWIFQAVPRTLETSVSLSHRFNRKNDLHYEAGDETVLSGGFRHRLDDRWSWSFQLNWRHTGRDAFLGMPVPSTGADYLHASPGLRFTPSPGTVLYAFYQQPVRQRVNEAQLAPRSGLVLGVSRSF